MQRDFLSFLDLVTQFLAVMIIVIAVSSRQSVGVGLVKPADQYETLKVIFDNKDVIKLTPPLAYSLEPDAASVLTLSGPNTTMLLISARRYQRQTDNRAGDAKVVVRVQAALANMQPLEIWRAEGIQPDLTKQSGALKNLNLSLIRFESE